MTVKYRTLGFKGFPKYRVGTDGSFWSYRMARDGTYRWKLLRGKRTNGYRRVELHEGQKHELVLLHRLILEAFVGSCPEGMEACHFPDRTRTNNELKNLRWDFRPGNWSDRRVHKTDCAGDTNWNCKIPDAEVDNLHVEYAKDHGMSQRAFARHHASRLRVSPETVRAIVAGRHRTALSLRP